MISSNIETLSAIKETMSKFSLMLNQELFGDQTDDLTGICGQEVSMSYSSDLMDLDGEESSENLFYGSEKSRVVIDPIEKNPVELELPGLWNPFTFWEPHLGFMGIPTTIITKKTDLKEKWMETNFLFSILSFLNQIYLKTITKVYIHISSLTGTPDSGRFTKHTKSSVMAYFTGVLAPNGINPIV
jgi:hypothetical protein